MKSELGDNDFHHRFPTKKILWFLRTNKRTLSSIENFFYWNIKRFGVSGQQWLKSYCSLGFFCKHVNFNSKHWCQNSKKVVHMQKLNFIGWRRASQRSLFCKEQKGSRVSLHYRKRALALQFLYQLLLSFLVKKPVIYKFRPELQWSSHG